MTPSITKSPGTGSTNHPGEKSRSSPSVRRSGVAMSVRLSAAIGTTPPIPRRSRSVRSQTADRSPTVRSTRPNRARRPVRDTRPCHSPWLSGANRAVSTTWPPSTRRQSGSSAPAPWNDGRSPVISRNRSAIDRVSPRNGGPACISTAASARKPSPAGRTT